MEIERGESHFIEQHLQKEKEQRGMYNQQMEGEKKLK